jgi:prepilin-type N-terminal cleavage/methylation domain-containing protein
LVELNCRSRSHHARACRQGGFTLVEMLAALMVFAILIAAVALGLSSVLNLSRNNRNRSVAAYLASQQMDTLRSTKFTTLVPAQLGQTTLAPQSVGGVNYTIKQDLEWVSAGASVSSCSAPSGPGGAAYVKATVYVSWPDMHGAAAVTSQSLLSPPVGAFDETKGHIGVQVLDVNGNPVGGETVTLGGLASASLVTTAEGCAFFAYLDPGSYTVSLSHAGYVDGNSNPTPSHPVTVSSATTQQVTFNWDRAATLQLTLTAANGGTIPAGIPLTLYNTSFGPPNYVKVFAGSGVTTSLSLFPYLSGYQVWAGGCNDAKPATPAPALATTPGGVTAGAVALATLRVTAKHVGGAAASGVHLNVFHALDTLCASGETFDIGTTPANGILLAALPYGAWTMQVVGGACALCPPVTLSQSSPAITDVAVTVP